MRRICAAESMHLRHGEDIPLELCSGTDAQREMFQDAVNRWWRPIMHFFGPPSNPDKDVLLYWGIKTRSNEDLRQEFFSTYVPKLWDLGITVPDRELRYDNLTGQWEWGDPGWDEDAELARYQRNLRLGILFGCEEALARKELLLYGEVRSSLAHLATHLGIPAARAFELREEVGARLQHARSGRGV